MFFSVLDRIVQVVVQATTENFPQAPQECRSVSPLERKKNYVYMHILNAIAQKVDVVSDNVLHGRARPSLWGTRKRQRIFLGNAEGMYAYYCIMDNEKTGFNECVCWRTFQFEMNGLRSKHFIFSFSKLFRIHVQCDHDHSIGFHAIHHVNIPQ